MATRDRKEGFEGIGKGLCACWADECCVFCSFVACAAGIGRVGRARRFGEIYRDYGLETEVMRIGRRRGGAHRVKFGRTGDGLGGGCKGGHPE